jgi:hypothetical protein
VERGRKRTRRSPPSGIERSLTATAKTSELQAVGSPALPHIQALIEGGGQIMIGSIAPIQGAAVAHDGSKTLVMLQRRPGEAIQDLLARLDVTIATAKSTGSRVDEINVKSSDTRYEI